MAILTINSVEFSVLAPLSYTSLNATSKGIQVLMGFSSSSGNVKHILNRLHRFLRAKDYLFCGYFDTENNDSSKKLGDDKLEALMHEDCG